MVLCDSQTADVAIATSDYGLSVDSDDHIRGLSRYEAMTIKFALRARRNQLFDHTRQGKPMPSLNAYSWYFQEVARIRAERPDLQCR